MVDEDATKKSNAALEDLLSGLNLDAKKNTEKGGDDARHGQGKSKNKKKKKDHRKAKEFKVLITATSYCSVSFHCDLVILITESVMQSNSLIICNSLISGNWW